MRRAEWTQRHFRLLTRVFGIASLATGAACSSTSPNDGNVWGSEQASLVVNASNAVLQIRADGGCYGSYADIVLPEAIPPGTFHLAGTFTQLTGVYPGHVTHDASFTGVAGAREMTLTVSIPALSMSLGPYHLTRHVHTSWPACLYP